MEKNVKALMSGLIVFLVLMFSHAPGLFADETQLDEVDQEKSSFTNATQVEKAQRLSELSAKEPDQETQDAVDLAESLKKELDGIDPELEPEKYKEYQEKYAEAQAAADKKMGEFASVPVERIEEMRSLGMGWGEIAHELGVHPGALGNGHYKKQSPKHSVSKTERNLKSEKALGHGQSNYGGDAKNNKGNSGGGNSGNKGNSGKSKSGKSNKGGNKK